MDTGGINLRGTLDGLKPYLEREFARGRIWYESDLHRAALSYLTCELCDRDERWVVGSQHWLGAFRPDILCYYRDAGGYAGFLRAPELSVRAVVELKFASNLGRDLDKLRTMQGNGRDCLAWMVYGDHFDSTIHNVWAAEQVKREDAIVAWELESPGTRGKTILKCGQLQPASGQGPHRELLDALNRQGLFWSTERFPRDNESCP